MTAAQALGEAVMFSTTTQHQVGDSLAQGAFNDRRREDDFESIIGDSDSLRYVLSRVEQVSETDATVLLFGETGTGKELLARAIHKRSRRRDRPFVIVNCAALPASLIESELFGRERGAFTGAHATQVGRFELANRGTLFLDEVGELPLELQPKLLRVLQSGELERLGSPRTIDVDVRLDIPLLVRHLVERHGRALRKPIDAVPHSVVETLEAYDWPGNVRELENVIQRAIIQSRGGTLELRDAWMPEAASSNGGTTLVEVERRHILHILEACRWRIEGQGGAAQLLALKSSTLRRRMLKLCITRPK
jgi:transcriptional regulator with GAF, ATPase, and Fis domain